MLSLPLELYVTPAPPPPPLPAPKSRLPRLGWLALGSLFGAMHVYGMVLILQHHDEYVTFARNMLMAPQPQKVVVAAIPAPAVSAPPIKHGLVLPADLNVSVRHGDTLMSMLMHKGIDHQEAYNVVQSVKKIYDPKHLTTGQSLQLHLDKSSEDSNKPSVSGLSIAVSPLKTIALSRTGEDSFNAKEIRSPVFKEMARGGGEIHSSLYQTGIDSGVPPQLLSEVIQALSYDVDFQRDIKEGDILDIAYERMHTDKNVTAGYGKVIYAALTLGDRQIDLYRHLSPDGYAGYYNAKGESVKKALLKTPINGARITSSFGMRMHPLLGYSKMHKGIDFGAATGTPIYAAGDGVIEEAGRKGGFGNYVRVKHSDTYETAYGHASRIAQGIRPGVHVKQGQVIAYVGSTGMSTGPHLHYEILVKGAQVNPSGVKFRTGQTLAGREMAQFRHEVKQVDVQLASLPRKSQVASVER